MERPLLALAAAVLAAALGAPAAATAAANAATPGPAGCDATGGRLEWGFKESFRAYIDGSIANGEWTVTGGAEYSTPLFSWSDGLGVVDPRDPAGEIGFGGSVRFTGHGGILDTTFADPVVRFDGGNVATLLLDVTGTSMDGERIAQEDVAFATIVLPDGVFGGDSVEISVAPATLTADGSAAFPDYEAGTALDPVSISFDLPGCELETRPVAADPSWIVILIALLAGGAIVLAVTLLTRRRSP